MRNAYKNGIRKSEGNRTLRKPGRRLEGNTETDFIEIVCEGVNLIPLA
jgi:hypothetical protein